LERKQKLYREDVFGRRSRAIHLVGDKIYFLANIINVISLAAVWFLLPAFAHTRFGRSRNLFYLGSAGHI